MSDEFIYTRMNYIKEAEQYMSVIENTKNLTEQRKREVLSLRNSVDLQAHAETEEDPAYKPSFKFVIQYKMFMEAISTLKMLQTDEIHLLKNIQMDQVKAKIHQDLRM